MSRAPGNRPRLLKTDDVRRGLPRSPAALTDSKFADSSQEESGFEPVWGFSCQAEFLVCCRFFVRSGKAVLRSVAAIRFAERAERGSRDRNGSKAWRPAA